MDSLEIDEYKSNLKLINLSEEFRVFFWLCSAAQFNQHQTS